MLQKIENFYLAILRIVVIGVAGILLAAVVYFGLNSIGVISPAPEETPAIPQVSSSDYKKALMGGDDAPSVTTGAQPATGKPKVRDEYTRAANALAGLYKKTKPEWVISEDKLAAYYQEVGDSYQTEELKAAFAYGLESRVHELIADPKFAKWAFNLDASDVLGNIISTFQTEFDKQIEEASAANERAEAEHAAKKAESMQMIYVAGAAFLAFLLIVFLSIIIRIERNLRPQPQS